MEGYFLDLGDVVVFEIDLHSDDQISLKMKSISSASATQVLGSQA